MKPKFVVVLLKELRETLRDKRAIGLLAMFIAIYPLMLGFMLNHQINRANKPEREGIALAVIGAAQAPTLMAQLKQRNVTIEEQPVLGEEAITELLKSRKVVALLRVSDKFTENYQAMRPARIELWFDSAADTITKQREVEEVLREYSSTIAGARLLAHGVSPATMAPIQVQRYDTGSTASRSATFIGAILGFFFFPAFIFCLSTAVDSTAGERERRSLEVLLAQPARPFDLIAGKWLAAGLLSVVGITLELVIAHVILKWLPLEEIGMSWRLSTVDLAWVCVVSISLSLFAAALEVALAMNAKSFKEAQSILTFVILIPMVPSFVVPMLDLKTADWMYMVPVLSNQTLLRELAKGQELGMLPLVGTFLSSMLVALLAVGFATWRLKSEKYVLAV